jgi:hypothetical protein
MRVWNLVKLTQNKVQWQAVSDAAIIYITIIFRNTSSWMLRNWEGTACLNLQIILSPSILKLHVSPNGAASVV